MPQLIHNLLPWLSPLGTLGVLGYALYLRWLIFKEFPSQSAMLKMKMDLDEFAGDLAALNERFTRFQKREGMRVARQERQTAQDLQREALDILANRPQENGADAPSGPLAGKTELYRKRRIQ